ncbi:MAG: hypothetical protein IPN14_09490 [Bacteroidetes bacterium]|nr:hypothetical protein [Bacteroidota bacterium]
MKKSICIVSILVLFCIYPIYAQHDTLYIDQQGVYVQASKANFYRMVSLANNGLFECKDYFRNHRLKKIFHATSAAATVWEGPYVELNDDSTVLVKGHYHNGFKSGEWVYYFHHSSKVEAKEVYHDADVFERIEYDSLTQLKVLEGSFDKFGKRTGTWKQYHPHTDSIQWISNYVIGKKEGTQLEFYLNGQLKRMEVYLNNKLQKGTLYNEKGQKVKYYPAFSYPQYKEYISNYLQHATPCTAEALKKNDFKVKLFITKTGEVAKAYVIDVVNEVCAERIKTALLQMKRWKPALWENQPINYTYETTIKLYVPRE